MREKTLEGKAQGSIKYNSDMENIDLRIDLFYDNIGIITITRENKLEDRIIDIDLARGMLKERRKMHHDFLNLEEHEMLLAHKILENALTKHNKPRGRPDTGNKNVIRYFYVFTLYHFIGSAWLKPDFLRAIYDPSITGIEDSIIFDENSETDPDFDSRIDNWIEDNNAELRHGIWSFISWSGITLVSDRQIDISDYIFLERRLQHAWLMLYTKREMLSAVIDSEKNQLNELNLQNIKNDAATAMVKADDILDPSLPRRDSVILDKMIKTSNLKEMKERIDAQITILDARSSREIAIKRNYVEKLTTSFLFLIALITAYPSFSSLIHYFVHTIFSGIISFLILLLFFIIFEVTVFNALDRKGKK